MEKKRKVREVILHIPEKDARIIINGTNAVLKTDGSELKFKENSAMLILLIENRRKEVSRQELKKTKDEDTEDKIVPNTISNIRTILKKAGMPKAMRDELLETFGGGTSYRIRLNVPEEDIIYGEEYREAELLPSRERTGRVFPTVQELAGDICIRAEYLPRCLFQGSEYARLEACVMDVFKRSFGTPAIMSPLIVSAVGGAGKTFSMLHLYGAAASYTKTAIYVPADSLADEEHNLLHYICQRYIGTADRDQEQAAFEHFVKTVDPVLLLIDGMNEISVSKQKHCCRSFNWMQKQYPTRIRGVFATRFPQWLKANLYQPLEAQLLPLDARFLRDKKEKFLQRLPISLTPLVLDLLDRMDASQMETIRNRYDLYRTYFDGLADRNNRKDGSGWIYDVLSAIAVRSMEGETLSNRWLKEFCAGEKEYGFLHSWCAGEEYMLDGPDTIEALKATGFLMKGFRDSYTIHQQFRDYLAVRYGLLLLSCFEISPVEFLDRLIDATRKYTQSETEDPAVINLRRHNNMDLGEFGFYAGLEWYHQHGEDPELVPLLLQLGIQVAYLYDNVRNLSGLYDLHCQLEDLLNIYLHSGAEDKRVHRSLPGYYFCLNRLVTQHDMIPQMSSKEAALKLSEQLDVYYQAWLGHTASSDTGQRAVAHSGLGGVYLARYRIVPDFDAKKQCLDQAIGYHSQARDLRQQMDSAKLYLSYAALGTDYYYKGTLLDSQEGRKSDAAALFREAAKQHHLAVLQPSNPEPYVSWTRMAGCWYQLLILTPEEEMDLRMQYRQNLLEAVNASVEELKNAAEEGGVVRLGREIRTLLLDVSRFLKHLRLDEEKEELVKELCKLYTQAFPAQKKPVYMKDRIQLTEI